jgi:quercetin dioxygenase-like cupin family protein
MTSALETRLSERGSLSGRVGGVPALSAADRSAVGRELAASLDWGHLGNADQRSWEVVRRVEEYEAWLIGWPPGGRVQFHDHGDSGGSVLVLDGALEELTPYLCSDESLRLERQRYAAGALLEFEPAHVHDLVNEGGASAVSVHVYSPCLESMTYFDLGPRGIVERETLRPIEDRWTYHLP